MTATEIDVTAVVDRYFAVWNERDPEKRRALIDRTWAPEGRYLDPLVSGVGLAGIDAMVESVQRQFPDYRFRRTTEIDTHHDRLRFGWELGADGSPPLAGGIDFGELIGDRLGAITGFLDFAPNATD